MIIDRKKTERSFEVFSETEIFLDEGVQYAINGVKFTVKKIIKDLDSDCMIYHTDIVEIDENLCELYEVEVEYWKKKYETLKMIYQNVVQERNIYMGEFEPKKRKKFLFF